MANIFLTKALKTLSNIPDINAGGCLIAIYAIYLYLSKNNALSDDFKIVALNDDLSRHESNHILRFKKGSRMPRTSNHYAFIFEGIMMDCNRKLSYDTWKYTSFLDVNIEDFCVSLCNQSDWNDTFNRELSIPMIEKRLGIDLSKIDKYIKHGSNL